MKFKKSKQIKALRVLRHQKACWRWKAERPPPPLPRSLLVLPLLVAGGWGHHLRGEPLDHGPWWKRLCSFLRFAVATVTRLSLFVHNKLHQLKEEPMEMQIGSREVDWGGNVMWGRPVWITHTQIYRIHLLSKVLCFILCGAGNPDWMWSLCGWIWRLVYSAWRWEELTLDAWFFLHIFTITWNPPHIQPPHSLCWRNVWFLCFTAATSSSKYFW